MESEYIYHITTRKEWEDAQKNNEYKPAGFDQDGFIHCSIERQVEGVLDRFYRGKTGLVKLKIEKAKVQRPVLFELATNLNELFPHIYGPMNLDCVVDIIDLN